MLNNVNRSDEFQRTGPLNISLHNRTQRQKVALKKEMQQKLARGTKARFYSKNYFDTLVKIDKTPLHLQNKNIEAHVQDIRKFLNGQKAQLVLKKSLGQKFLDSGALPVLLSRLSRPAGWEQMDAIEKEKYESLAEDSSYVLVKVSFEDESKVVLTSLLDSDALDNVFECIKCCDNPRAKWFCLLLILALTRRSAPFIRKLAAPVYIHIFENIVAFRVESQLSAQTAAAAAAAVSQVSDSSDAAQGTYSDATGAMFAAVNGVNGVNGVDAMDTTLDTQDEKKMKLEAENSKLQILETKLCTAAMEIIYKVLNTETNKSLKLTRFFGVRLPIKQQSKSLFDCACILVQTCNASFERIREELREEQKRRMERMEYTQEVEQKMEWEMKDLFVKNYDVKMFNILQAMWSTLFACKDNDDFVTIFCASGCLNLTEHVLHYGTYSQKAELIDCICDLLGDSRCLKALGCCNYDMFGFLFKVAQENGSRGTEEQKDCVLAARDCVDTIVAKGHDDIMLAWRDKIFATLCNILDVEPNNVLACNEKRKDITWAACCMWKMLERVEANEKNKNEFDNWLIKIKNENCGIDAILNNLELIGANVYLGEGINELIVALGEHYLRQDIGSETWLAGITAEPQESAPPVDIYPMQTLCGTFAFAGPNQSSASKYSF